MNFSARLKVFLLIAIAICILQTTILISGIAWSAPSPEVIGKDLEVSAPRIYAYYGDYQSRVDTYVALDDKIVKIKAGTVERIEFKKFDEVNGPSAELLEIETTAYNYGSERLANVILTLSISPKVGRLITLIVDGEEFVNSSETERSSEWFAPIIIQRKEVAILEAHGSATVTFDKMELQVLINKYLERNLIPTKLNFEVSLEPQKDEQTFKNNTKNTILLLPVPVD